MKNLRYILLAGGILVFMVGLGFSFQVGLVTSLWPWPDGRLSYLFVGSILVAASASLLWIGWTGELGALAGGTLNLFAMSSSSTIYFFYLIANGRSELLLYAIGGVVIAITCAVIFLITRKIPLQDERPTPKLVRYSYWVFSILLCLVSSAMILRIQVFPWPVNPDSSVIFGCIFLGSAVFYSYPQLSLRWHNSLGQLLSFLFYDIILIYPFLVLFKTVKPELMLNLILYVAVLVYSSGLAIYFLFINKKSLIRSIAGNRL